MDHIQEDRDKIIVQANDAGVSGGTPPVGRVQEILRWQNTAGNRAVGARLDNPTVVQRQSKDAGVAAPPQIVSVPDLVAGIKKLLAGTADEGRQAVEWMNSYNVHDIARALRQLKKDGLLAELGKHAAVRPLIEVSIKAVTDANTVTDDDLKKVHSAQQPEFRAEHHVVEDSFLPKLEEVCTDLGCKPEDLLAPMMSETGTSAGGLKTDAVNPGSHAAGLIQFMPGTLKSLGYADKPDQFAQLNATAQLSYVHTYFLPAKSMLTSAGRVYQFMFVPGSMKPGQAATQVVASKNHPNKAFRDAYEANAANLDLNKDEEITLAELEQIASRHVSQANALLAALRARRAAKTAPDAGPPP